MVLQLKTLCAYICLRLTIFDHIYVILLISPNNSIKPRCAYLTIYDYVSHEKDIREKVIHATRVYITNDENIGIDTDYDEHLTIDDITPDSIYLLLQELRDQPKK